MFRVGVEVALDYDSLKYFCETNNINHHSGRDAVRRDCCGSSATAGVYPQACQQLYDYYSVYISFVAQIFDNAAVDDLTIEVYLSEVVIAFTRENETHVTSLIAPMVDDSGVTNYSAVLNEVVVAWRRDPAASAITILMTHYHDAEYDGIANIESVCTGEAVAIVWDVFRYFTVGVFAHEVGHMLGGRHIDMPEEFDRNDLRPGLMIAEGEVMFSLSCLTQLVMLRFLGFGMGIHNKGDMLPMPPHCVHWNEVPQLEVNARRNRSQQRQIPTDSTITPEKLCGAWPGNHRTEVCGTSTNTFNCQTLSCAGLNSSSHCVVIFNSSGASGLPPDGMSCSQSGDFCYKGQCIKPEVSYIESPVCSLDYFRNYFLETYDYAMSEFGLDMARESKQVRNQTSPWRFLVVSGSGILFIVGVVVVIVARKRPQKVGNSIDLENPNV